MIQAADVGVGIVGKEGKQASLAADFSITQFKHVMPLLLWHGRNAYKRSARLSQFVMHRGLIISIMQAVFSALFYFSAISLFDGWLMVGYATFYTMLPVLSLVLDSDVDESKVYLYPELYEELRKGRPLSLKTFFIWLFQSVYQGGSIMILALLLFESRFLSIIAISFTALIASELINVAMEVHTWHAAMIAAEVTSVAIYIASIFILDNYFGHNSETTDTQRDSAACSSGQPITRWLRVSFACPPLTLSLPCLTSLFSPLQTSLSSSRSACKSEQRHALEACALLLGLSCHFSPSASAPLVRPCCSVSACGRFA